MKNSLFKGSLILMCAGVLGKLLGALYRIPLSNILGPEGVGIYQMVFAVFSLALIVSSGGVSASVAHKIAKIRAGGSGSEYAVFFKGLIYSVLVSLFFLIVFVLLGQEISRIQGTSEGALGYLMAGVALVFSSALASFRGLYQGHQNMVPTAVSQVIEQVFKVVFGLLFAYLFVRQSLALSVFGAFLGIAISEVASFIYLVLKTRKFVFVGQKTLKDDFFKTNAIITTTALIIPLVSVFDSFVVVNLLSEFMSNAQATSLFGLQSGIVSSIINLPVVASVAISLALLPELSYNIQNGNKVLAKTQIEKMFLICFAILVPCVLVFVFFGKEILLFLYPSLTSEYLEIAIKLLQISSIEIVFLAVVQIMTSVFQSLNKPQIATFVLLPSSVVKVVLTFALVSSQEFGIMGMAISTVLFYGVGACALVFIAQKHLAFCLSKKTFLLGGTLVGALAFCFWLTNLFFEALFAKICFAGLGFIIIYVLPLFFSNFFGIRNFFVAKLRKRGIK